MTLRVKVKERLGRKFDDEIRFFKGWVSNTKAVGAIIPTSSVTARRMASVVNPAVTRLQSGRRIGGDHPRTRARTCIVAPGAVDLRQHPRNGHERVKTPVSGVVRSSSAKGVIST